MTSHDPGQDARKLDIPALPETDRGRNIGYAVFAILGIAFCLRVWGIGFALPYDFTPDELHEIVRALKLGAGEYSWAAGKGGLYYFMFVEYGFLYVYLWLTGVVNNPNDFALYYLQDPSAFYLAGRITVAVMGTLTCLVIYLLGRRLYGWKVGIAAAVIGATAHYHGLWSHYINVDIGMVLAVWASLLAYTQFEHSESKRWLMIAGAIAGVAFAFKLPGAIVILPMFLAIASRTGVWSIDRRFFKEAGIVVLAMIVATSVIAPENILEIRDFPSRFTELLLSDSEAHPIESGADSARLELRGSIDDVTILQGPEYLSILAMKTYIVMTLFALMGALIGVWRKRRWDIIWCVFIIVFLAVMSAADRPGAERYMLPIVPALWLLSASAAFEISQKRPAILSALVAVIVVIPLYALIEQDFMWTRPDTRVLGKNWIEENVPADSRILIDGMRYRFIQSPPLNPNEATVSRRMQRASGEKHLSRGISGRTLDLYSEAMAAVDGPKFDLYSTVWGIGVKDLDYYVESCFDYIVTSSMNSNRFTQPGQAMKYPVSAKFYRDLPVHDNFELVYAVESVRWQIQGPTINVYRVLSSCD